MCRQPDNRDRRRRRRAFTLAEVLACVVILGLIFVAMLSALGHETLTVQGGEQTTVATFLAEEVRDMVLRMPFQDVLNLNGAVFDPAVLSTGAAQERTEFSQVVSVVPLDAGDLATAVAAEDATAAHLIVMVRTHGKQALIQDYYLFDLASVRYLEQ